jgi:hypothetical protein
VNRIPADADCEITDSKGKIIFADGEYRDGYACPPCMAIECDRCDKIIAIDEDITPCCVFEWDKGGNSEFSDGAFVVHEECLTKKEKQAMERNIELGVL